MSDDVTTRGLEELVAAAALNDEVAAAVAARNLDALGDLGDLGVELSAVEQRIFLAADAGLLERLSDQVRQRTTTASKRDFLTGAATAAGVLAAAGLAGCADRAPAVTRGISHDRPHDSPPPARDAGAERARPAPNPRDYPAPTGVRPDRPRKK